MRDTYLHPEVARALSRTASCEPEVGTSGAIGHAGGFNQSRTHSPAKLHTYTHRTNTACRARVTRRGPRVAGFCKGEYHRCFHRNTISFPVGHRQATLRNRMHTGQDFGSAGNGGCHVLVHGTRLSMCTYRLSMPTIAHPLRPDFEARFARPPKRRNNRLQSSLDGIVPKPFSFVRNFRLHNVHPSWHWHHLRNRA